MPSGLRTAEHGRAFHAKKKNASRCRCMKTRLKTQQVNCPCHPAAYPVRHVHKITKRHKPQTNEPPAVNHAAGGGDVNPHSLKSSPEESTGVPATVVRCHRPSPAGSRRYTARRYSAVCDGQSGTDSIDSVRERWCAERHGAQCPGGSRHVSNAEHHQTSSMLAAEQTKACHVATTDANAPTRARWWSASCPPANLQFNQRSSALTFWQNQQRRPVRLSLSARTATSEVFNRPCSARHAVKQRTGGDVHQTAPRNRAAAAAGQLKSPRRRARI